MGRRKQPVRRVQTGTIYFVDKRFERLGIYRRVLSRQWSKNHTEENFSRFMVRGAPINTTLMVTEHAEFFGREYVKVIAANSDQEVMIGYITLNEFKNVVRGDIQWVTVE